MFFNNAQNSYRGTFFTIEHEVVNIYNKITDFFGDLDVQKLYKCLLESVKLTFKHWDEVNNIFSCESFGEVTHKEASEVSFFLYFKTFKSNCLLVSFFYIFWYK